jgi:L-seryl-tRNA(Ser) seleniumtransferase
MELRDLPGVDSLAADLAAKLPYSLPAPLVVAIARRAIDEARSVIMNGGAADPAELALDWLLPLATARPRRVLNATGVLLHTNLGRAPLAAPAAAVAADQAVGYVNLEVDLTTGARGGRGRYTAELLATLTGAEAALVVNNNAGGLLLSLAALAGGERVLVSRGELIEIGGSFRLPDLMASSGAILDEVGTTNRTRLADYERSVDGAAAVLKVHPSNYRVEGFTEEVGYAELAGLAAAAGIPFIADVGSGLLDVRTPWLEGPPPAWLAGEPGVRQTLEAGASVVLFSGDKLLGGPQAGVIVGATDAVDRIKRHPMARALRVDRTTQAALIATLEAYAAGDGRAIPFWAMATMDVAELTTRSNAFAASVGEAATVVDSHSVPGAGSVPGEMIPSPAIRITCDADAVWHGLMTTTPPVMARRKQGALEIDLRTVPPGSDGRLTDLLVELLG